jgi:alkylation response protein AidB-like acyl-CoA dehydrogenase
VGFSKRCTEIVREWSNKRVQWGLPIGKHEAVAHKIADITTTAYAMDALSELASELAMREGYDIRLEAAVAKEWASVRAWRVIDETMQIRGGRGYETERSLGNRGEAKIGVERIMRDSRINLIFEGSSEIMHLFIAREAVDKHLSIAGSLIDPKKSIGEKLKALPAIAFFYAWWYPTRWLGFSMWPRYAGYGALGAQLRFCNRMARKLARAVFHGMLVHGPKLERRQGFLFRLVDIANELFAITAAVNRAVRLRKAGDPSAQSAEQLAVAFGRGAQLRIAGWFRDLWANEDAAKYALAQDILAGRHAWMEQTSGLPPSTASQPDAESKPSKPGERAA